MRRILTALAVPALVLTAAAAAKDAAPSLPDGPDFKDVLSLPGAGGPRIAPDGSAVLYTVRRADWDDNRYDTEIHLVPRDEEPFQLTRTPDGSSTDPEWSPDGKWIAFLADRGAETQIHLIRPRGGEALALTAVEQGVEDFEWSPDGRFLAVVIREAEDEDDKEREERYGAFAVEDAEYRQSHLWVLDVGKALEAEGDVELPSDDDDEESDDEDEDGEDEDGEDEDGEDEESDDDEDGALRRLTGGDTFTVTDVAWSPDGASIAFSHQPDPLVPSFSHSDLSVVDVATGEIRQLVERPGFDSGPIYSPDGAWILFSTGNGVTTYYTNSELAKVPAAGGEITVLTSGFDEDPSAVDWLAQGVRFLAVQRTERHLFHLDPETGETHQLTTAPRWISSVDFTADGKETAFSGHDGTHPTEIYRGAAEGSEPRAVTSMSAAIADWAEPTGEVVTWTSEDDTEIEGVLYKPDGFEPGRRYPLLVIIHGGPTGISRPQRLHTYVYPVEQWLAKGAMVLMPNYRGSAGYGEAFRSLNVRNLGVGDAWDVLSGVEHLVAEGVADPERLGAMGWSQGGYISAFLTTTSDRFKAVSVGAGISDWRTYYVNTDIHPFTRHYLQGTPWDDPEIYDTTSPMHYIGTAKTPTLIQHGEFDRRVPIPNAYELYQGLEDMGVATRLVVYKGFGHGITKPRERLAAMWHNWQWFARYVWSEEVELPID